MDTIITSVRKTGRAVIVDEDTMRCGPAAEMGMQIMERAFDHLDAPVKRVCAANYPVAGAYLEQFILPQPQQIADAIVEVTNAGGRIEIGDKVSAKGALG
jgi:pyruvate dehydrogenase E1 component beta subunit